MNPLIAWAKQKLTFQESTYAKKAILLTFYYGVYQEDKKPSPSEVTKESIKIMGEMYRNWASFPKSCMNKNYKKYQQLYTKARNLTADQHTLTEKLSELTFQM